MSEQTDTNVMGALYDGLQRIVDELAAESEAVGTPRVELTRPKEEKFGDFATNVALLLAPVIRSNPREVATRIAEQVQSLEGVSSASVAGPGFVNLTLNDSWFHATLRSVLECGDRFGSDVIPADKREKILLEFVSANPTGPMVLVSARHAAYGDSLARLLAFAGHDIDTEYYVNDRGTQVRKFGESLVARVADTAIPENGYEGEYVIELAKRMGITATDDPDVVGKRAVDLMVEDAKPVLEQYRVSFDRFQSEAALHDSESVSRALEKIRHTGQVYEHDGATFLRTTAYGDDKDRAIVRSNGEPTYYAADIGYLLDKFERGIDRSLLVLGADHHGYVARLKAATSALGYDPDACEVVIMQMVHLLEGNEVKKMSKRRGDIVPMGELIERIGVDAARYFLVQRSHDQSLEIDLEIAEQQNAKNPVYYVQYAHARICSIVRKASAEMSIDIDADIDPALYANSSFHPSERRLIKRIAEFPFVVSEAAERRAIQRLTVYASEIASDFSQFYRDCYVIGEGVDRETTLLRLSLCGASRQVLARCLQLVGVSAPEQM